MERAVSEVFFYHLQSRALEQVLPELLDRTVARGWRAVVQAASDERVEALAAHLWTYSRESFLPHGSAADGNAERQPVWLTAKVENLNQAAVLFLVDGADSDALDPYERVCDIFDGNDEGAVTAARARWQRAKSAGHKLVYWQQGERGWEKKAEA